MGKTKRLLIIFLILKLATAAVYMEPDSLPKLFEKINKEYQEYDALESQVIWESLINPSNVELPNKMTEIQKEKLIWKHTTCEAMASLEEKQMLNGTRKRLRYILCRGPIYTYDEYRQASQLNGELSSIYQKTQICIPTNKKNSTEQSLLDFVNAVITAVAEEGLKTVDSNQASAIELAIKSSLKTDDTLCLTGNPHFECLMYHSENEEVLRISWLLWRYMVGPPLKEPYLKLIEIKNRAARRNGYNDIGATIRDELEFLDLRSFAHQTLDHVRPLYTLLHGVMRFYLKRKYGDIVPEQGLIPAHLLGDLWGQSWHSRMELIHKDDVDIDGSMKNWTVLEMLKKAEDFYKSLGFPAMTEKFWNNSSIDKRLFKCQVVSINMFSTDDYRIFSDCEGNTLDNLFAYHREMANVHYYMAAEEQAEIFQTPNDVLSKTISNAIVFGVNSPHHLHRLGLVNDSYLFVKPIEEIESTTEDQTTMVHDEAEFGMTKDEIALLKVALNTIPKIPFSVVIDEYRWKLFEGTLNKDNLNTEFWELAKAFQGISPPGGDRGGELFDIGPYIHVSGNIPYVRHYLTTFLELQLFEKLCKITVFGAAEFKHKQLPLSMGLHRCDIYGSKDVGKVLRKIMTKGNSENWREVLQATLDFDNITTEGFDRYYKPLKDALENLVFKYNIPLGW